MKHINEEEQRLGPDKPQIWYSEKLPQPQAPFEVCYYFDYVFGTSTGGLIAIMLGRLRMSVDDALKAYENLAGKVFAHRRPLSFYGVVRSMYDHRELVDAVNEVVRMKRSTILERPASRGPEINCIQDMVLNQPDEPRVDDVQQAVGGLLDSGPTFNSDPSMCRTVCVAYAAIESSKEDPFLFRSYEHLKNTDAWKFDKGNYKNGTRYDPSGEHHWAAFERNPGPAHALPIASVARCTTAATGFFKPMTLGDVQFVDGALGCNNPSAEALNEVIQMHNGNSAAVKLLLSVGTGQAEVTRIGRGRLSRMVQAGKAAVGVLTGTEETHQHMLERASDLSGTLRYERFNVPKALGIGEMPMDIWNDKVRERIKTKTEEYLNSPSVKGELSEDENLRSIAQMLVKARRERAATRRWPISTSQVRYRCTVEKCDNGQKVRNTFDEMWSHIQREHFPKLPDRTKASREEREKVEKIINSGQVLH
ncbi:MAG: hypothetical protein MMC33_006599 [Icmadophila ericetorum]|nr:hypothetical protein [Icmadophila ericetorum]